MGLAHHSVNLIDAAFELWDRRASIEVMPLTRLAFESSITCQWVNLVEEDARNALVREDARQRKNLADSLRKCEDAEERALAETLTIADTTGLETSSVDQSRSFEKLTSDLRNGEQLYVHYRLLSAFSHPGMTLPQMYWDYHDGDDQLEFGENPDLADPAPWATLAAQSLILAVDPVSCFLEDKTLRKLNRGIASRYELKHSLELSDKFYQRRRKHREKVRKK